MIRRDYLVIGAGIGGASACEGIRKYDKRGSVTLVGAEALPPYKRWILSKGFLREKEANLKKLQEVDERWLGAHKIEARFGTVVTQFNIERRLAVLANGESIEFTKACLAMGSRPVRPAMAGTSLGNVTRSHYAKWRPWRKPSWSSEVVCWHANRQQACA